MSDRQLKKTVETFLQENSDDSGPYVRPKYAPPPPRPPKPPESKPGD